MAKPPPAQEGPPQTFDQTVEEFCQQLSAADRNVELIAGFYADEKAHGRHKDSADAFGQRYAAFANRPV
jgi:hypothetical protein